MFFGWLKRRCRRKLLARPFPDAWRDVLERNMKTVSLLDADERARLEEMIRVFAAEKSWEGCGGFELTDEAKVTVAGQACLLLLGLPDHYDHYWWVHTILIYPAAYVARRERFGEYPEPGEHGIHSGEAWHRGPVVLSWDDVVQGGRRRDDGRNVVYHEFAHQLDMVDGLVDGTPPLNRDDLYDDWRQVMTREFESLIAASERGEATLLDTYGATAPAEFFAVATECFFERPRAMKRRHEKLYDLLSAYYRQDTAGRCGGGGTTETDTKNRKHKDTKA